MKGLQVILAAIAGLGILLTAKAFAQGVGPYPGYSYDSPQILVPEEQPYPMEEPGYIYPDEDDQGEDQPYFGQEPYYPYKWGSPDNQLSIPENPEGESPYPSVPIDDPADAVPTTET
jgi:hypothetical protein